MTTMNELIDSCNNSKNLICHLLNQQYINPICFGNQMQAPKKFKNSEEYKKIFE